MRGGCLVALCAPRNDGAIAFNKYPSSKLVQPINIFSRWALLTPEPVAANHLISSQTQLRRLYDHNQRTVIARSSQGERRSNPLNNRIWSFARHCKLAKPTKQIPMACTSPQRPIQHLHRMQCLPFGPVLYLRATTGALRHHQRFIG